MARLGCAGGDTEGGSIRVRRQIDATSDALWQACTTAEGLSRWQADEVEGSLDDGLFRLTWPGLGAGIELEVVNARAGERLVLRSGDSMMELKISAGFVEVTHTGVAPDEQEGMASSWAAALALLEHYLRFHQGADRLVYWFAKTLKVTPQAAHVFFTEAEALAAWLTTSGAVPAEGERYDLALRGGRNLAGRVLSRTEGRDVVLSWEEDERSTVTLRTLPGPLAVERTVALAWSRWSTKDADIKTLQMFEAAVDRLAMALRGGGDA